MHDLEISPESGPASGASDRSQRFHAFLVVACFAAAAPIWSTTFLPMVDLPQHAAQVATGLRWDAGGFDYPGLLTVNRSTPYLLANGVVSWLARVVPVPVAFRVVLSLAFVGMPLATFHLLREVEADPRWAVVAIPAGYSYSWFMGFVAFVVATPMALFALLRAWRYAHAPTWRGGWTLVLLLHLLFFTHVLLFGWVALVGAVLVAVRERDLGNALRRWWPFALSAPLPAGWVFLTWRTVGSVRGEVVGEIALDRFLEIPSLLLGMPIGPIASLLGISLLAAPMLAGGTPTRSAERWVPFTVTLLLFALVPYRAFGTSFLSHRFAALLLPTLLFGFDRSSRATPFRSATLPALGLAAAAWVFALGLRLHAFDEEVGGFRALLERIEPSQRVLYFAIDRDSEIVPYPVYLHFGCWAQVERGGFVEFSFARFFPNRYRFRSELGSLLPLGFEWRPWQFDWARHGGELYAYLLVRSHRDPTFVVVRTGAPAEPLARAVGGWWLYRLPRGASDTGPAAAVPGTSSSTTKGRTPSTSDISIPRLEGHLGREMRTIREATSGEPR